MKDENQTRKQLMNELGELRKQIAALKEKKIHLTL